MARGACAAPALHPKPAKKHPEPEEPYAARAPREVGLEQRQVALHGAQGVEVLGAGEGGAGGGGGAGARRRLGLAAAALQCNSI